MKNSLLLLVLLLVLCISLPFIFNVKYAENFATYPSETDMSFTDAAVRDASFISDVSFVSDASFTEGMTNSLDEKVYSSYDKLIDKNLRNKGNSISDYMRRNPPDKNDEFKNRIDSNTSIIDFLSGLFRNNKEAFTSTHTLKDVSNNVTYDILPNQELYNVDGELKLGTHDSTDYGALLDTVKKDFIDLKNKYDSSNYVTKKDVADGLEDLTQKVSSVISGGGLGGSGIGGSGIGGSGGGGSGVGGSGGSTSGMSSGSMSGSVGDVSNNITDGSSTNMGSSGSSTNMGSSGSSPNYTGVNSSPTGVGGPAASASKCIANFGTEIDEPLCCGQEGVLKSTKYTCPENYPTCTGYKCGSNFGTCS